MFVPQLPNGSVVLSGTSTATETAGDTSESSGNWQAGVLVGIVGVLIMGGLVLAMSPPVLAVARGVRRRPRRRLRGDGGPV